MAVRNAKLQSSYQQIVKMDLAGILKYKGQSSMGKGAA
jgi:hypothetical protein